MTSFKEFNTGRGYSAAGQIIQCSYIVKKEFCDILQEFEFVYYVSFLDVSRGITGKLKYFDGDIYSGLETEKFMQQYDNGNYTGLFFGDERIAAIIANFIK